jgi:erythromycin esterase-like protein
MRSTRQRLGRSTIGLVLLALLACGAAPPTADQPPIEWLRRSARPFVTCEPGGTDRDLVPLRGIVGDARIVALGEVSSGTHEFFQMKHRIVEYLAAHMGFTLFAIEANMPEAYRVNEYILTGRGDSKALVAGISQWGNTREFLDVIEWMREFNRSGRGRLQFIGFDMQSPTDSAAAVVTSFVARVEPTYLDSVKSAYRLVATAPRPGDRQGGAPAAFPASVAAGHKVRLSGWIRTADVHYGAAGLWWRADAGAQRGTVAAAGTRDSCGTTPWTPYNITVDVPANTTSIVFGCILQGGGTAWFDSLAIEIDGKPVASTDDLDLTMERTDGPVGFSTRQGAGSSYVVDLDSTTALAGKRSLRVRRVVPDTTPTGATWQGASAAAAHVLEHLEAGRSRFVSSLAPADLDWAILNARTISQMSEVYAGTRKRVPIMAENVASILDHAPGSKVVLWADNLRLAREVSLGAHLANRYGREMVIFGFAFHEGRYSALVEGDRPGANDAKPSAPGSLEWACHSTGIPRFTLDLRSAAGDAGASAWLARPLPMRSFAFRAIPDTIAVAKYFDALIFFDHTTPSTRLP